MSDTDLLPPSDGDGRAVDNRAREESASADRAGARPRGFVDELWALFSSLRLALGLILGIAALSLVGVLVVQAPAGLSPTSPDFAIWLQRVRPRYGVLTDVLAPLQLFSVASSLWMRLLLSLLVVNTLVCTLNRWPRLWRAVFHPPVDPGDATFASAALREELAAPGGLDETLEKVRASLARHGYRVVARAGPVAYLYADRHRFGRLGTLATHLAIILVLVGALVTSLWGFRHGDFVIPEGSTRPVGFGTSLAVKAEAFVDEYYPEGPPKDYRSDLVLYADGVEVKRQTVRVNEPLSYGGVRFHQSFFGPAVVLRVEDAAGNVVFDDGVALDLNMGGRPVGYFQLPSPSIIGFVVGPSSAPGDPTVAAGQIRVGFFGEDGRAVGEPEVLTQGQPKTLGGLTYTFVRERQFTGLQVVRDPGAPIIWVASALLVAGMAAVFYFPHRRLWARCRPRPGGGVAVSLAGVAGRDPGFAEEFAELVGQLRAQGLPVEDSGEGTGATGSLAGASRSAGSRRAGGHDG